jgi:hypothetical protein
VFGLNLSFGLGTVGFAEPGDEPMMREEVLELRVPLVVAGAERPFEDHLLMLSYRISSVYPPKYSKALRWHWMRVQVSVERVKIAYRIRE